MWLQLRANNKDITFNVHKQHKYTPIYTRALQKYL